jgi:hypothetical protein
LKHNRLVVFVALLSLAALGLWADTEDSLDDPNSQGSQIINRYLQASQAEPPKTGPVEVDIDAAIPKLNVHGRLQALRRISDVGKITYRVLGFQGDNSVKSQVIARYLQAEQESQDKQGLSLTPANYKFKLKGARVANGQDVYVFQVAPRAKRVGLFKGEVWLDAKTCLPVFEKGRFVKNPSIFFRKVDFERAFAIQNGSAVPARMRSTIDTRFAGKVNLSVAYSSPTANQAESVGEVGPSVVPASFMP